MLDSDTGFLQVLSKRLEGAGWQYRVLASPVPLDAIVAMRLNAIVIDLAVLGPQGWNYLEKLCTRLPGLGVVVCTGRSSVAQRVRGLRLGADDWMTKPCHPEELIARVEAVVRRRKRAEARVDAGPLVVGEVEIRPDQFQAFVGGVCADLTRREFELIQLLADADGPGPAARGDLPAGLGLRDGPRRPLGRRVRAQAAPEAREGVAGLALHPHALRDRVPVRAGAGRRGRAVTAVEPAVALGRRSRRAEAPAPELRRWRSYRSGRGPGPQHGDLRNFAILLLIAVAVWQLPGRERGDRDDQQHPRAHLRGGLVFFGYRLYMEHRSSLFMLEDRVRALLYGSVALIALALIGTAKLWDEGGLGVLVWLALIGAGAYGCVTVWRTSREY